ncbi:LCP family protein [Indiicoccus explosivorum]|uniref:LCP family glycopolymer transferase n=1 Tax=Indiicoccus explosivorum TaxID=1917864 RepID=UPI000B432BED|nr:LCP family protein [Indiicoccus explosivorum]
MRLKRKKAFRLALILFGLTGLAAGVYLLLFYNNVAEAVEDIYVPLERNTPDMRIDEIVLNERDPFSVLLLGVDERENDRGRSDTMIVLTINPDTASVNMLSIPRDTYTEISGLGMKDKINHAYAFGGIGMSVSSVEQFLDIPIDYVIEVNMDGFRQTIDALDGVTIRNPLAFDDFKEGEIQLDGEEALAYVRMRKQDPRGDFGRQDRQKLIIESIVKKCLSVDMLVKYDELLDVVGENVKTNLTLKEMMDIRKHYSAAASSISQIPVEKGHGEIIGGIWYYLFDEAELLQIRMKLQQHLEVD